MKTNYIKCSLWLMAVIFAGMTAKAQTSVSGKTAYNGREYISYDGIRKENGKQVETIQTNLDDKLYKIELVNDKMTEMYVDGVKIAPAVWDKYSDAIAAIREQIRKNKIQALRNQEQAVRNQEQAKKNQEQAVRNQEQEEKNQQQAVRNQEQAQKNQEQAVRNKEQEEKNQGQVARNQEQAVRNQQQAVRNQEQAKKNQLQAEKNRIQAEENERLMKQLVQDLVADKIIPDENSLHDLTINSDGMTVNGVKQPDGVFKKYKEKYDSFSMGDFSYHN